MGRLQAILVVILMSAGSAHTQVRASLTVPDGPFAAGEPYRLAVLELKNDASTAVRTVLLDPAGGGPTVRYDFIVPPGQDGKRQVALPALWPVQDYRLTALDRAGAAIGWDSVPVTWPGDSAATGAFIDDAFGGWRYQRQAWPERARRETMLLLGVFAAAAAGTMFIKSAAARMITLVVVAIAAVAGLWYVPAWGEPVRADEYYLVLHGGGDGDRVESFAVLASRRTVVILRKADTIPYPVYPDREAAVDDDATVDPLAKTISLRLSPGKARIVRPASAFPLPLEPLEPVEGTAETTSDGRLSVRADFPHDRAFVVRDDDVWPAEPGPGTLSQTFSHSQAKSIWRLVREPETFGLQTREAELARYWRIRHQRTGLAYLLNFRMFQGRCMLRVLTLTARPGSRPRRFQGTMR